MIQSNPVKICQAISAEKENKYLMLTRCWAVLGMLKDPFLLVLAWV